MSDQYKRLEIPEEAERDLAKLANRINTIKDQWMRLTYIAALVYENARLTAECNDHRQARGFELLPTYNPMGGKNNGRK